MLLYGSQTSCEFTLNMEYKIVIVGQKGVGKSTFLKRHRTGEFDPNYIPTLDASAVPLTFDTTVGKITLKVLDCVGDTEFTSINDYYCYQNAHGVICMFDLTNIQTAQNILEWKTKVRKAFPTISVVVCGNKADLIQNPLEVIFRDLYLSEITNVYPISIRDRYNFDRPFLDLMRMIIGNHGLNLVPEPPPTIIPKMIRPSTNALPKYEKKEISWVTSPGWKIKVIHEFYRDDEL